MAQLPMHLFEPVLTAAAMRAADQRTIEELGLPGRVLMESAGRGAADLIEARFGPAAGRRVLVLCGRGNNGGDGLVLARVLHARGADVRACIVGEGELTPDASANLELLEAIAAQEPRLRVGRGSHPEGLDRYWAEWVIDALLGIGVTEALREPIASFARWINDAPAHRIALDLPTGLDSDSGEAHDGAVRAELTVSMATRKAGLVFGEAPTHAGEVHIADIGIPRFVIEAALAQAGAGWRSTDAAVAAMLPPRPSGAHKYSAGRVFAVAGSLGFPGAAVMTAAAAARAGAGAVVVAMPAGVRAILEARLSEVMSLPMQETDEGSIAAASVDVMLARAAEADAVIVGPGLGRHPETQQVIRTLIARVEAPIVLDADGLNALAGHTRLLRDAPAAERVLTPHLGEMRRLAGDESLTLDRAYASARTWAERLGCILLLKGSPSVVATPGGEVFIGGSHTPALATAGSGDVLTGVIGGLMAQGMSGIAAAVAALHLTGRAAERFAAGHAARTMLAGDILVELPHVLPA